uniref:C-type lectin domain-containing protein n=1 Tax=Kryptolebias marmoratus TaxID=37003 RepID=A0A3Q3BA42_KRYMA
MDKAFSVVLLVTGEIVTVRCSIKTNTEYNYFEDKNISINLLASSGFCATSDCFTYHFTEDLMTWSKARFYCKNTHRELLQDKDVFESTAVSMRLTYFSKNYTKAWIGIRQYSTWWAWMDGNSATYFNWSYGEPDGGFYELCVFMTDVGDWHENNCSDIKQSVCFNVLVRHQIQ